MKHILTLLWTNYNMVIKLRFWQNLSDHLHSNARGVNWRYLLVVPQTYKKMKGSQDLKGSGLSSKISISFAGKNYLFYFVSFQGHWVFFVWANEILKMNKMAISVSALLPFTSNGTVLNKTRMQIRQVAKTYLPSILLTVTKGRWVGRTEKTG